MQIGSCGVNPAEFKYHFQDAGPQNDYPYKGKQKGMHVEKDYGPQKVKNQLEYVAEHGVKNVIRIYSFLLADTRAADAHQYVEGCPYDWKQYGRGRQGWFAQQVINIDIITDEKCRETADAKGDEDRNKIGLQFFPHKKPRDRKRIYHILCDCELSYVGRMIYFLGWTVYCRPWSSVTASSRAGCS